jgi:hypothetical protein
MGAYEAMGGDPFHELQTRAKEDQAVFLPKGTEVSAPKVMSNGEPIPGIGLADAPTSKLVGQLKSGVSHMLDRRAALERKIRRMLDYGDQLQSEIDALQTLQASAETDGSLENIVTEVGLLFADRNYRAVSDDKGNDEFAKLTYAPQAGLDPGPDRANPDGLVVERGGEGAVISGEGGSTA